MQRLTENHDVAQILPLSDVPPVDLSYVWVPDYVKAERIQEKIDLLIEERSAIDKIPISKAEFLGRLRPSYDDLCNRAAERLRRFLSDPFLRQAGAFDPFKNFEIRFVPRATETLFIPTWADIELAVKSLPDTGLDDTARLKMLRKIDAQIAELRSQMPLVSLECKKFVAFWQNIQGQLKEPSGPRALHLDASPEPERRAWKFLSMQKYLNPAGLKPNSAD